MAYLSVAEYIRRFGERETTLLTNEDVPIGGGTVSYDAGKLEEAISDATEEVEGYIGRRYAIPLASPPPIVKGWVAAIARLKLSEGTGRVGDAVKEAADRTYSQLKDMVASRIDLPVPENSAPLAPVGSGSAMSSQDRAAPVFGNSLDTYLAPFTGGGDCTPNWMRTGR